MSRAIRVPYRKTLVECRDCNWSATSTSSQQATQLWEIHFKDCNGGDTRGVGSASFTYFD